MAELFGKAEEKVAEKKAVEKKAAGEKSAGEPTDAAGARVLEERHLLLEKLFESLTDTAFSGDKNTLPEEAQGESNMANGTTKGGVNGNTGTDSAAGQPPPKPQAKGGPPHLPKPPLVEVDDSSGRHRFAPYEAEDSAGRGAGEPPRSHIEQHRWIQAMNEFSAAFKEVPQPTAAEAAENKELAPVRVALIDDGVDTTSASLLGRTYRGKSFDFYEGGRRSQPYWVSKAGHGTAMAKLIRSVCPTAEIYVIKLGTEVSARDVGKLTIDPDSAIKVSILPVLAHRDR
ncbi:hypothetical protein IMZ48_10435 [Candidatus Bathyarchaeota archaeon]|nr:hypothetical protein [Candidatus Bathyarchaeota archaeon]